MNQYIPNPIDTSDVQLPRDLNNLMEELARSNHDTWAENRIKEGWTYGSSRNDSLKQNPCIVPYEDLPETEKDYDRNTSGETLKSIYKLGFAITKRTQGQIMLVGEYTTEDIDSFKSEASKYENKISYFPNWQTAKSVLVHDLTKWHAIILDTNACLSSQEEPSPYFLRNVLDDLNSIFSKNRNEIPWFIVPKTYDDFTEALIRYTVGRDREKKDWGHVLYQKESEVAQLFYDISELLPNTRNYRIRCVYEEVFDILENYFPAKTKDILFNILLPLHYPEIFYSFVATDYYNNLRRILEALFKVCNELCLIPSEICYKEDGSVNLSYSCRYLVYGADFLCNPSKTKGICFGTIGEIMSSILRIANEGSHMGMEYKTEGLYFSIMAFSLQLCDVLSWFGKYIKEHDCRSITELRGKTCEVDYDEEYDCYYYGKCIFPKNEYIQNAYQYRKKVKVGDIKVNTCLSKSKYPFFAYYTK